MYFLELIYFYIFDSPSLVKIFVYFICIFCFAVAFSLSFFVS